VKVTKRQLKNIIKEELEATMGEGFLDDYVAKPMRNAKRQVVGQSSVATQLHQWATRAVRALEDLEKHGYKDELAAKDAHRFAVKAERSANVAIDGLFKSPELTAALQQFGSPTDPRGMNSDIGSRKRASDELRDALKAVAEKAHEYREGGAI
jgi:hypothetical protein